MADNAPHPILREYYDAPDRHRAFVRDLFDESAAYYDRINDLCSLGTGTRYRRECLVRAGARPGLRIADIAIGTGLVATEAAKIVGNERDVIGVDLSRRMLAVARTKLAIPLVQGTAEQLPFAAGSIDLVTMGYALRHVEDLVGTFREFHRVLRPGGSLLILEIARPTKRFNRLALAFYLGTIAPILAYCIAGRSIGKTLMDYYWQTIQHCVAPEVIVSAMVSAGFAAPRTTAVFDMFRSYSCDKQAD